MKSVIYFRFIMSWGEKHSIPFLEHNSLSRSGLYRFQGASPVYTDSSNLESIVDLLLLITSTSTET